MSRAATDLFLVAPREHHLLEPAQLDELARVPRLDPTSPGLDLACRFRQQVLPAREVWLGVGATTWM
jgi:hypothetical protein